MDWCSGECRSFENPIIYWLRDISTISDTSLPGWTSFPISLTGLQLGHLTCARYWLCTTFHNHHNSIWITQILRLLGFICFFLTLFTVLTLITNHLFPFLTVTEGPSGICLHAVIKPALAFSINHHWDECRCICSSIGSLWNYY